MSSSAASIISPLFCKKCFKQLSVGAGFALSCQCFFCQNCLSLQGRDKLGYCPICKSEGPDVASLSPKLIPEEIKPLITNLSTLAGSISEAFEFQLNHYVQTIQAAAARISQLEKQLLEQQQKLLANYSNKEEEAMNHRLSAREREQQWSDRKRSAPDMMDNASPSQWQELGTPLHNPTLISNFESPSNRTMTEIDMNRQYQWQPQHQQLLQQQQLPPPPSIQDKFEQFQEQLGARDRVFEQERGRRPSSSRSNASNASEPIIRNVDYRIAAAERGMGYMSDSRSNSATRLDQMDSQRVAAVTVRAASSENASIMNENQSGRQRSHLLQPPSSPLTPSSAAAKYPPSSPIQLLKKPDSPYPYTDANGNQPEYYPATNIQATTQQKLQQQQQGSRGILPQYERLNQLPPSQKGRPDTPRGRISLIQQQQLHHSSHFPAQRPNSTPSPSRIRSPHPVYSMTAGKKIATISQQEIHQGRSFADTRQGSPSNHRSPVRR